MPLPSSEDIDKRDLLMTFSCESRISKLDGFFHNKINIWDVAAGALLVEEAGGIVNNLDKFDQNNIDIRASSSAINEKMLENLKNF